MNKVRSTVKHMPRKAKLLTALLACVLVITLIGVAMAETITITPNNSHTATIDGYELQFSRPAPRGDYDTDSRYPVYNEGYESWSLDGRTTLTGKIDCLQDTPVSYDANEGILQITNKSEQKISLSFTVTYTAVETTPTLNIDTTTNIQSGTVYTSKGLAKGESILIDLAVSKATVAGRIPNAQLTLSNITAKTVTEQNLTLLPGDNGTYTAQNSASGSNTVNVSTEKNTIGYNPSEGEFVTLKASPEPGCEFYLWVDDQGKPISVNAEIKVDGTSIVTSTIRPVFVKSETVGEPAFYIPGEGVLSGNYYYWDDAMNAALNGAQKNVVLLKDISLDKVGNRSDGGKSTEFEIPNGVTLVVPYSTVLSTSIKDAVNTTNESAAEKYGFKQGYNETGSAFRTLTVPADYTLNVNGTLNVNALQGSSNGGTYHSHVVSDYGSMVVNGTVNVNAAGKLYARGYVTGTGNINVLRSGTMYQMLQMVDWRGGVYSAPVATNSNYPTLPFSGYYLQNNMVHTTYNYGANMEAQAVIAASNDTAYAKVAVISNGDATNPSFFVMGKDASVVTEYDSANDRLKVTLNGNTSMNCLKLSAGSYALTTEGKELAISDNIQVTVASGKMTIAGGLKFLPGAKLTVAEGAALEIANKGKAFFYAKDDYNNAYTYNAWRNKLQAANVIADADKKVTPADDATLDLHGSLVINGTLALSKSHPGLAANPNANITVNKTYGSGDLKLYEPYKGLTGKTWDATIAQPDLKDPDVTAVLVYEEEGAAATETTKAKLPEAAYVFENRGWTAPKGAMVDDGSIAALEKGTTYKAHNGAWYSHEITVNYDEASVAATKVYTAKSECTFAAPSGYVITGITTGNTGVVTANADTVDSTPISDGWKSVNLSNITAQEATLTATVKSYAYDVTWVRTTTEGEETKTTTTHSYLPSGTGVATLTFDGKVNIDASKVKIDDNAADNRFTSTEENGKTVVKVTGITQNTRIEVPYSSSNTVTWVVTTDEGKSVTTKAQTVAGSATYPLGNTESNDWKVVELGGGVSIQQSADSKAVLKARTDKTADITVTDVLQDITVNITVTTYKHKVTTNTTVYDADQKNADKSETIEYFTNDATYKPALTKIRQDEKYVVSAYTVTGGTLESKGSAKVCAVLPDTVAIDMSNVTTKETTVSLTLQSYLYVWNWDATLDGEKMATNSGFTYTEYLTDRPTGDSYPDTYRDDQPYYLTLRDYGETGKYYHYSDKYTDEGYFAIDYRSMGNNRFTISGTQGRLPDYTGEFGEASLADGVLTEVSWMGKITLKDEQVTVALVSYATKVTVKTGTDKLPEGIFYADANGKDVTTGDDATKRKDIVYGQFAYGEEGYDAHRFVKSYTIGSENAPGTTVNDVGALLGNRFTDDSVKKFSGMTIPADTVKTAASSANGELTVSLTTEEFWQVYAVSEDNGVSYNYLMFVQKVDGYGPAPIYAPKAEKFNVSCTRQTDEGGTIHYSPTLKVKEGENWFFQECVYGTTIDIGGKTLNIEGDNSEPKDYTCAKMVRFTLTPYTKSLTWNVGSASGTTYVASDGKAYCGLNEYKTKMLEDTRYSNGTWTYTVPTGKTVAPNGLTSNYCDAAYKGGKVTVSGLTANSTVSITTSTETPTEANTSYYMGDMSFEYVRNAAAFTWDGKTEGGGSWKPVNSFGWRHAVGSKSYEVGDETLTVDNGSILFVNTMQNTPVTYTVQLSNTDGKDYGVSLMFDESENIQVSNDGVATVTVQPGEQVTLVCRMTGTPDFSSGNEIEIGTITVTRK